MSDGLKAHHRAAIIATLAANHRVEKAVLFGSRAMGANTVTSDVDVALFGQQLTLTDQANLAAACEELPMAQSVDLVLHSTIDNPALVEHIRSHGVEWYRRGGGSGSSEVGHVGSGWHESTLGDVVTLKRGYDLPKKMRKGGNVPVVSSSGVSDYHNVAMVKAPGVVTGRYGTIGNVYYIQQDFFPLNTSLYVQDFKGNDPRFISYYLKTIDYLSCSDKAAVPGVNRNHLHLLKARIPPLPEQKAIAHVLGTLDDKIELNRQMNETLEAMAKALFKSWFVDFDPMRAKAEGRSTGLPDEISALFPDSFEDSELGEIPRGWGVKPLSEIASFLNGLALQKHPATSPEDSLPVIKIAELRNGISAKTDKASRSIPKKYIVTDGDFLFSWSGSLMAQFWTGGEGALNQHLFKVTSDHYPPWFFAGWVQFHLDEFRRIAASKATTMGHIQRSHLQAAMASCPPDAALTGLGTVIELLVKRGILARLESRSLAEIRDVLLPGLMSGQIQVHKTECFTSSNQIQRISCDEFHSGGPKK
ncbi:MAG TPA: type I restriction endonuclease subunit S [Synechococcus sp. UBA8638]|nr:type I restriction endonuclease subunit S [Synechococcus sp. UBA8638]